MYACFNSYGRIVELLLKHMEEREINVQDRMFRNPLHWACRHNNSKIATLLLEAGVNVN